MVTGFCERASQTPYPIVLSPRSQDKAAKLKAAYPDRVEVAETMQEVVDRSDWVMLAVLPGAGEEVCRSLRFRREQKIINFMSDKALPQIREWIGETAALSHMVPLTFNAFSDGPIVLSPPNQEAAEIFGHIGRIIPLEERYHAAVLAAVTGCVAPFFTLMDTLRQWSAAQGVPEDLAARYVTGFFGAVCQEAAQLDAAGLHRMANTATPGGINYMVKDYVAQHGGFQLWAEAMEPALARLTANIPKPQP